MAPDEIKYRKEFYDNVHGFVRVTKIENEIIDSPFFQRLRNISQLGLLNYIFPGALHNRFNHSLGVLHIADKMTVSLQEKNFLTGKRKVIRMAALLHDIGHYPLSHLIENVIKEDAKSRIPSTTISIENETSFETDINYDEHEIHKLNVQLHALRNPSGDFAHHERISNIVISRTEIHDILLREFSENEINEIMQIISGAYPGPEKLIIHSELDADRFDYLLRDSQQTGVIYGLFDIDQIIRNLELYEPEDNRLVVGEKGRNALEHYLLGRYFLYSSVLYHKTTVGFDLMVHSVYRGLIERKLAWSYLDLIDKFKNRELTKEFLEFTDSKFFSLLREIDTGKMQWDKTKTYDVNDDLFLDFVDRLLQRKPLKLFFEHKTLTNRDENSYCNLMEPAVKDRITALAGVEDYWYIPFELGIPITEISPYISLCEKIPPKYGDCGAIKILRTKEDGEKDVDFLVADKTSILHILGEYQLNIRRIYTKNEEYRNKLNEALDRYEAEKKKS